MELHQLLGGILLAIASLFGLWVLAKLDAMSQQKPALKKILAAGFRILWLTLLLGGAWKVLIPRGLPQGPSGMALLTLLAISLLTSLPVIQRWLFPRLGLDPERWLHAMALYAFYSYLLVVLLMLQRPEAIPSEAEEIQLLARVPGFMFGEGALEFIRDCLAPLLAVGWLASRNRKEVAQRLGLRKVPVLRTAGWVLIIYLASSTISQALDGIFALLEQITGLTLSTNLSPPEVLALTATAILYGLLAHVITPAVTEELVCRGVFQPKLGILYTSFFFMLMHLQYGPAGLTDVFVGSLLLGFTAKRYSLWAAMGFHALHNLMIDLMHGFEEYLPDAQQSWLMGMHYLLLLLGLGCCFYLARQWCSEGKRSGAALPRLRYGASSAAALCLFLGLIASFMIPQG